MARNRVGQWAPQPQLFAAYYASQAHQNPQYSSSSPPTSAPRSRPHICCRCAHISRHGSPICYRCNHPMCSECQVFSLESDIIIGPIPTVEIDVETPKEQEEINPIADPIHIVQTDMENPKKQKENCPVSANTRSAKKKKISVVELGNVGTKCESGKRDRV